jgi:hypothetical protein
MISIYQHWSNLPCARSRQSGYPKVETVDFVPGYLLKRFVHNQRIDAQPDHRIAEKNTINRFTFADKFLEPGNLNLKLIMPAPNPWSRQHSAH